MNHTIATNDFLFTSESFDENQNHSQYVPEKKKNKDNSFKEKIIIEEILLINITNETSSLSLLQNELSLLKFIYNIMKGKSLIEISKNNNQNQNDNYIYSKTLNQMKKMSEIIKLIIDCLDWCQRCSFQLTQRIMKNDKLVQMYVHENNNALNSSYYRFCTNSYKCQKFYSNSKTQMNQCQHHHFVHNFLYNDISLLKLYFNKHLKSPTTLETNFQKEKQNILKFIKTCLFVTRHMADELSQIFVISKYQILQKNISFSKEENNNSLTKKCNEVCEYYHRNNIQKDKFIIKIYKDY